MKLKDKNKNKNNKSEILQEFFLNALTLAVLNQSWLEVVSEEKIGYQSKVEPPFTSLHYFT